MKKIKIPQTASRMLLLARDILKHHDSLGADSPLSNEIMDTMRSLYELSKQKKDEKDRMQRQSHIATEERNQVMGIRPYMKKKDSLYQTILQVKAYLKAEHFKDERQLGAYGFEVDSYHKTDKEENESDQNNFDNLADPS